MDIGQANDGRPAMGLRDDVRLAGEPRAGVVRGRRSQLAQRGARRARRARFRLARRHREGACHQASAAQEEDCARAHRLAGERRDKPCLSFVRSSSPECGFRFLWFLVSR